MNQQSMFRSVGEPNLQNAPVERRRGRTMSIRVTAVILCILTPALASTANAAFIRWEIGDGGNGHLYQAILTPGGISWADAQAAAVAASGSLATITSPEENAFVFDLVDDDPAFWDDSSPVNNHGIGPWLGGLQPPGAPEPGGGWEWVTGEPWSYTNWGSGMPNEAGDLTQDRLQFIGINTLIGPYWNDLSGVHVTEPVNGYIIERVPEPSTLFLAALTLLGYGWRRRRLA